MPKNNEIAPLAPPTNQRIRSDTNGLTNGHASTASPAGSIRGALDNGWTAGLFSVVLADFDKTIMKYPALSASPVVLPTT